MGNKKNIAYTHFRKHFSTCWHVSIAQSEKWCNVYINYPWPRLLCNVRLLDISKQALQSRAKGTRVRLWTSFNCPEDASVFSKPQQNSILSLWPFAIWRMDIIEPLSLGKGQCKFLLEGADYFTKWIEVESMLSILTKNVQNFVWRNIICHFDIPHTIITKYGWQFIDRGLIAFYKGLDIKLVASLVEHS